MKSYDILTFHPRRHHNFEQTARLSKYFDSFKHVTGLYFKPSFVKLATKFSKKIGKELNRRSYETDISAKVDTFPSLEISRLTLDKLGKKTDFTRQHDKFGKFIVENYTPPKICLGFDTLSKHVFEQWHGKSFLILDLVIGLPQYRAKMDFGENFTKAYLDTRPEHDRALYKIYERELELADLVLCGSEFVKKTCLEFDVPEKKLRVINYGVDVEKFKNPDKILKTTTKNLKFIFAGAVGYRKGADTLVSAWKKFAAKYPDNELHFFGNVELDFQTDIPNLFFHGSINQADLIAEMRTADIFVFPSTFEGSAYSIYQSMAMKLAVITTENSGTVLKHEESALIIQPGDDKQIVDAMERLLLDTQLRKQLSETAYTEALKYTWDNYGEKLKVVMDEILQKIGIFQA